MKMCCIYPVQWRAHECNDWWCAKHEHLWMPQPTRSMQTLAMWRSGSVLRRPEWGLEPMQLTFPESPGHPCQTHLWAITITDEPLLCEAKRWDAHHPGPPHSFNATLLHAPHHGASQQDSYQHNYRATGTTVMGCAWHLRPSPRAYCSKQVTISHSGVLTPNWGGGFPAIRGHRLCHFCPGSNLHVCQQTLCIYNYPYIVCFPCIQNNTGGKHISHLSAQNPSLP